MERPDQHDTDKRGQALLFANFARAGWEVTPMGQGTDYGRDFTVEVFRNKKTTGIVFNIQLKSSVAPSYSANGDFISISLKVPNARYLAHELKTPSILMQADVTAGKLFWSAPQIDLALLTSLATKRENQSCTARVLTSHELPAAQDQLLDTVTNLLTVLAARAMQETSTREFVAATTSVTDSERLRQELRDKADALEMMQAQALTETGDFDAARRSIQAVIDSPLSSVESKFFALLVEEKNERLSLTEEDRFGQRHADVLLETAEKLRKLTRKGPPPLKFYALVVEATAQFFSLTREDWGLYQNWKVHQTTGDIWWRANLRLERAETANRVERKLRQFLRLVRLSETTSFQAALPLAFLRIVEGGATLINRLEFEGLKDASEAIRRTLFRVCKLAAEISAQYSMDNERAHAVAYAAMLSRDREAGCVVWANAEAEQIPSDEIRSWALERIADQPATLGSDVPSDEPVSVATEQQIYRNMAHAVGIDLSNPSDPIAEMVNVGIADFDPTRVLRNCEHMFLTLGRQGHGMFHMILAQQLQLPTMGPKVVHCSLHKYTRNGMSLDETYERFRADYCDKCPDHKPRPQDWQYTHEWQLAENQANAEFMSGPRSATYDHKPVGPAPPIPMPGNACASCGLDFAEQPAWWCGFCQTWFCQRPECTKTHPEHPHPF